jgi:hypothetical protein
MQYNFILSNFMQEKCETITSQKASRKTDIKLRRQISENETVKETTQLETIEPSNVR